MNALKTARALGWVSLAIAATEFFGRKSVGPRLLGINEHPHLMRGLGLREAAAGATILSQHQVNPTLEAGLWSRVAGDVVDLTLLAFAATQTRKPLAFLSNALTVTGITVLDICCACAVHQQLKDKILESKPEEARAEGASSVLAH